MGVFTLPSSLFYCVIAKIRHCALTGLDFGAEKFRIQVADMIE